MLGDKADKVGKDDNFRGLTIFNNVVYFTKGSGSNGVNTVYFVDTTGTACPKGVGIPAAGATLPIAPLNLDPASTRRPRPAQQHVHPRRLPHRAREEPPNPSPLPSASGSPTPTPST